MAFETQVFPLAARRSLLKGFAVLALGGLAACASAPPEPGKPAGSGAEEVVGARAQERWEALIAGDLPKAYGFLSPGSRQVNSLNAYSGSIRVGFWKKARVERVECPEADLCQVHVQVEYVHRGTAIVSPVLENWTRSGEDWWIVLK